MLINVLKQQAATAVVAGRLVQAKNSCYGGVRISQQVPVRAFRAGLYGEMVPRKCIVRQVRRSLSLTEASCTKRKYKKERA